MSITPPTHLSNANIDENIPLDIFYNLNVVLLSCDISVKQLYPIQTHLIVILGIDIIQ